MTKEEQEDFARRLVIAFVQGGKFWQFHRNGSTAFPSERDELEAEAERLLALGVLGKTEEERHDIYRTRHKGNNVKVN